MRSSIRAAAPAARSRIASASRSASAAGLSLGGGKGVICAEPGDAPTGAHRRDLLLDFADTVNVLEGNYVTAEDVGTSSRDMAVLAKRTEWVTGLSRRLGGSGDPS